MMPVITLTSHPDAKARSVIEQGLSRYNAQHVAGDSRGLAVIVSDPDTQDVLGGILGRTSLGVYFIDIVFLPDELRGRDLGRRMMDEAEDDARRRGCRAIVLYTISFQAPGFYEKLGYRTFGTIDCLPPGIRRHFMVKDLD